MFTEKLIKRTAQGIWFVFILMFFSACQSPHEYEQQPNIVVIMADDIGLGDLSIYHRERADTPPVVTTPNIDKLAKEGQRFNDAHSPASLCAPTRFSMLTGNFSYRNGRNWGVWTPEADALIEPEFTTVARIAKAGGYHTAFFGKWGLGGVWNGKPDDYSRIEEGAVYYGFDYSVELPQGIQNKPYVFYENQQWMMIKPGSELVHIPFEQTGYARKEPGRDRSGIGDSNWNPVLAGPTLAGKAVDYIERQADEHPGEPFYLYYCSQAVHVPHHPTSELDGISIAGTTPGKHGDMIRELDTQVGMIMNALKETGVYDNTLIVFTSDNGGLVKDKTMVDAGHLTSNGFRGHKGSIYEGGHRVPFIAMWPGKIKPNSISHEPIVSHDMVATITAISGQSLDTSKIMDSANLLPYFEGTATRPAHKYLMHQSGAGPSFALREGSWKLIMKADLTPEEQKNYKSIYGSKLMPMIPVGLYNLEQNPAEDEAENLIDDPLQAGRIRTMFDTYKRLRTSGEQTAVH